MIIHPFPFYLKGFSFPFLDFLQLVLSGGTSHFSGKNDQRVALLGTKSNLILSKSHWHCNYYITILTRLLCTRGYRKILLVPLYVVIA